jgi:hypothetical protein
MRRLLVLFIAAQIALPTTVWAEAAHALREPQPQDTERFFQRLEKMMSGAGRNVKVLANYNRETMKKMIKGTIENPYLRSVGHSVAHNTQTLVLLWILGAVESVHQQQKLNSISKSPLKSIQDFVGLALGVGSHMINSTELFASMLGASAVGRTAAPALGIFNQLAAGSTTRPFLAKLLTGGVASFVTFLGWEAGHRIIEEGIYLLEEGDIKVAKELKFTEMMMGRGTQEQRQVFARLMGNVWAILSWSDPQESQMWLYNTWRLNIMTGEFFTMLVSMVTAGTAAGTLVPGPGWLVGFAGGLVGGLVAIFIPAAYKRPGTDALRRGRMNVANGRMQVNERYVLDVDRYLTDPLPLSDSKSHMRRLEGLLRQRSGYRADLATALIEQAYDGFIRIQESEMILKMIEAGLNAKDVQTVTQNAEPAANTDSLKAEAFENISDGRKRFAYYFAELLNLQIRETEFFGRLIYPPDRAAHPMTPLLIKEFKKQEEVHVSLRQMQAGLFPEKLKETGLDKLDDQQKAKLISGSLILLNLLYMRSFDENYLIED